MLTLNLLMKNTENKTKKKQIKNFELIKSVPISSNAPVFLINCHTHTYFTNQKQKLYMIVDK